MFDETVNIINQNATIKLVLSIREFAEPHLSGGTVIFMCIHYLENYF